MSVNNYECPKCHNVFPESNRFMHDIRCTENNPLPLNQSRIIFLEEESNNQNQNNLSNFNPNNDNYFQNNQNNRIQNYPNNFNQNNINNHFQNNLNNHNQNDHNIDLPHRPQPRLGLRNEPISHRDIFHNIRESILEMPQTFDCWLCGQTLPESEKIDHMLCHQIQDENERNISNDQNNLNQNQIGRPLRNLRYREPSANNNRHNNNRINQRNNQSPQMRNNQMTISNNNFYRRQENNNQYNNINRYNNNNYRNNNNNRNRNNLLINIPSFRNEDIFHNRLNQLRYRGLRNNINNRRELNVRLPETKIDNIYSLDPEKRRCTICLCDFIHGDNVIILPCIHMYHAECIKEWLKNKDFCPLCKIKISDAI